MNIFNINDMWKEVYDQEIKVLKVLVNSVRTTPEKVLDSVSIAASGTEEFTITADI